MHQPADWTLNKAPASAPCRTWIDIDLDRVVANYRTACGLTQATVTCVLKANAYGHGAVRVARALQQAGCRSFAVSCGREALELRRHGVTGELLVMGPAEPGLLARLVQAQVTLTAASLPQLREMEEAAASVRATAIVHLKVDTGFHRLGFACTEESAAALAELLPALPHVEAQGLYSHLGLVTAARDEAQHAALLRMRDWLTKRGISPTEMHLCDSIGLVRYPQWHYSRCRVGALLFGVRPSRSAHMDFADEETLAFRAMVAQVTEVPAGEVIGYDESGETDHPMRIATLCAGYGDGYPRCLSGGRGRVLLRGRRAPVVGLVCMDQLMVDVTDIPDCVPGDCATLLGGGISYSEYAEWAGSNRNECLTILSRRPVRIYHQGGKIVTVEDSLEEESCP